VRVTFDNEVEGKKSLQHEEGLIDFPKRIRPERGAKAG
jgi:hypothetical protein